MASTFQNTPLPSKRRPLGAEMQTSGSGLAPWARVTILASVMSFATAAHAALNMVSVSPANGATNVCTDTLLRITFDAVPSYATTGQIRIYTAENVLVDTLDMTLNVDRPNAPNVQTRPIGTATYYTYPVIVSNTTACIYPHLGVLAPNQTCYVTITSGVFSNAGSGAFGGISDSNTWSFTTKPTLPPTSTDHLVVAADGSGDFCTVQGVLDFIPTGNTPRVIDIRNGEYEEIVHHIDGKHKITYRGESRAGTIIKYANNANLNPGGAYNRWMCWLKGDDVAIENMTLTNSTPKGGSQAEALSAKGRRFIMNHATLASYQDTLRLESWSRYGYYYDCLIQGDVDFIWNDGVAVFQDCEIRAMNQGYNCNIRNEPGYKGAAFLDCTLTKAHNFTGHLFNRNGTPDCFVAMVNCRLDTHIAPVGWSQSSTGGDLRLWEYQSTDITGTTLVNTSSRHPLSQQINSSQAALVRNLTNHYAPTALWLPQLAPNIISQPGDISVDPGQDATFAVEATGIETANPTVPDGPSLLVPLRYQWLKYGTNISGATNASLTISTVSNADAGAYSVIVSNLSGIMISRDAALVVEGPGPPVIESAGIINNQFSLTFTGDPGLNYGVQCSTNLIEWQTIFTTNAPSLPFVWSDADATSPEEFYRIFVNQ